MKGRTMRAAALLSAAILMTAMPVFAEGYGGYAGAFLRMGAGAHGTALGDAGTAAAMGVEQAHYNPAGLPYAPNNEAHIGYHVLSLDRRLAHVGAMYQLPQLHYWEAPMRTYRLFKPEAGATKGLLSTRHSRKPGVKEVKPSEYAPAVVRAALNLAQTDQEASMDWVPVLVIDGKTYEAPPLREVVLQLAATLREEGIRDEDRALKELRLAHGRIQYKPAAIALRWTHAGTGDIDGRGLDGTHYGTLDGFFENRFSLSFGVKAMDNLSIGVTAGVLYGVFPGIKDDGGSISSLTFGADAGIQYRPLMHHDVPARLETLVLGVAAYDLGGKHSWNTDGYWSQGTTQVDEFPRRYRGGLACSPVRWVQAYADLETDLEDLLRPKAGASAQLMGPDGGLLMREAMDYSLALRAGYDRDRPTFGIGLGFKVAGLGKTRLDYAFVPEPVSPEPTQIISWRFGF
ncbi:hypothetical protein GF324_05910 [bacterium]|nr:hypothetical protein [bacterium]